MNKLAKNSIYNFFYTLANLLFPLINSIFIARCYDPQEMGMMGFVQNYASYFVVLSSFGIPAVGLREVAKVKDDKEKLQSTFGMFFLVNFILTSVALVIYLMLLPLYKNSESFYLYKIAVVLIIFNYFSIEWLFQGIEDYKYILNKNLIVKTVLLVSIFLSINKSSSLKLLFILICASVGLNGVFNFYYALKKIGIKFKIKGFSKYLTPFIVLGITVVCNTIYSKIDVSMLGRFAEKDNVGIYNYAQKIIQISEQICISITGAFLARLTVTFKDDNKKFKGILKTGLEILTIIIIPFCMLLYMYAPNVILVFFGNDYYASYITVRVLVPIVIIKGYGNLICYQVVLATGKEKVQLIAAVFGTVTNVILNYLLIPYFYQNGAAAASVIAELVLNLIEIICLRQVLKGLVNVVYLIKTIIASSIGTGFSFVVYNAYGLKGVWVFIPVLLGIFMYIIILFKMENDYLLRVKKLIIKK